MFPGALYNLIGSLQYSISPFAYHTIPDSDSGIWYPDHFKVLPNYQLGRRKEGWLSFILFWFA
jgi:hypothetical protein